MRINKFVASATGLSRRAADQLVTGSRITVNGQLAKLGDNVSDDSIVLLDNRRLKLPDQATTIMLNKPVGYVCSRDGQGSKTIYELLPDKLSSLKPVGRLDKDSSGLLILTNDGQLANQLTHPRFIKSKIYRIKLNRALESDDMQTISNTGVRLDDGISKLNLKQSANDPRSWQITMYEGRNRQIRRTFEALGYKVVYLHRTNFGPYALGKLLESSYIAV